MRGLGNLLFLGATTCWVCGHAVAADLDRIKPKEPTPILKPIELPKPLNAEAGDTTELISSLKAILFTSKKEEILAQPKAEQGVTVKNVPLLDSADFKKMVTPFMGKPLSMKGINNIRALAYMYFFERGRSLVSIIAPEQDLASGVLQILVLEGRVGKVTVEGNRWFTSAQIADKIRVRTGEPVYVEQLVEDLCYINSNPFRYVDPVLSPGKNVGETDLTLKTKDRFPVRFFAGYEDSGNEQTGQDRYFTGFNWGNAFFAEHEMGYQFTSDFLTERSVSHAGYWRIPLPNRHKLSFSGSYSSYEVDVDENMRSKGTNWEVSGRYIAPLPGFGNLLHEAQIGVDFKKLNSNLAFGGADVFSSPVNIAQVVLEYSGSHPDPLGNLSFTFRGCYSPGHMTNLTHEDDYQAARAFTNPEYLYGTFQFERIWKLPEGMSLVNRFRGQVTSQRLLWSEMLGLGGYTTVRGYDEQDVSADQGFTATVELRSREFMLGRIGKGNEFESRLQALVFTDYGYGEIRWRRSYEKQVTELMSVGGGLRYRMGTHLNIRCDYGWELENVGQVRWGDRGRIHLGVTASY